MELFAWVKKIFAPQPSVPPVHPERRISDSSHSWNSSSSHDDADDVFNDSDLRGSGCGDSPSDFNESASSDSCSDGGGGGGGGDSGGDGGGSGGGD